MFWKLLLAFTVIPAVEIFLLVQVGKALGAVPTVAFVLGTGVLGAALARREGTAVLRALVADLKRGLPPAARLVEGAMVLTGAVLLVSPGVLTDLVGIVLILPWPRRWLAPVLTRRLLGHFKIGLVGLTPSSPARERAPEPTTPPPAGNPFDHPVS